MRIASSAVYNKLMLFVLVSVCWGEVWQEGCAHAGAACRCWGRLWPPITAASLWHQARPAANESSLPPPPVPTTPQREIDGIFRHMLLEGASAKQQAAPLTAATLVKLPRWRKVDPLVKSYLGNTLHLLGEAGCACCKMSMHVLRSAGCCTAVVLQC